MRQGLILLLIAIEAAAAPGLSGAASAPSQLGPANTWIATSTSGLTLSGTWTATVDPGTGRVSGAWTLRDTAGHAIANGNWSAAKSPDGWQGAWRANVAGRPGEYAGTWSTSSALAPKAPLADLFRKAGDAVVSGRWRAGGQSGAWSIRAFDRRRSEVPREPVIEARGPQLGIRTAVADEDRMCADARYGPGRG